MVVGLGVNADAAGVCLEPGGSFKKYRNHMIVEDPTTATNKFEAPDAVRDTQFCSEVDLPSELVSAPRPTFSSTRPAASGHIFKHVNCPKRMPNHPISRPHQVPVINGDLGSELACLT